MHVALIFNSIFYLRTNEFILDGQLQESPTIFLMQTQYMHVATTQN